MSRENVEQLVAHEFRSAVVPTLQVCVGYGMEFARKLNAGLRMAHDAGVLLGWGTDATEHAFASSASTEWTARSKIWGISNIELLKQATINSAKINGTDELRGSIKVGKRADFAIIDGNPDEDLTLFDKPCAYVLKDGKIVAREGWIEAAGGEALRQTEATFKASVVVKKIGE